jgi:hypothetical protein
MKAVFDWLQRNKEWVFSGAGVTLVVGVIALMRSLLKPKPVPTPTLREPALRVNLAFGFLGYGPELSDQMLVFTVANASERPVQIAGARFPLKDANMFVPFLEGEKRIPCMIDPATKLTFWVKLSSFEATLRSNGYTGPIKVHVVATDALRNDYASNSVPVG